MGGSKTQYFKLPDGSGCEMAYKVSIPSSATAQSCTPLFLINGLSAIMVDWSPLFEALGETRPVIISDHRGIGESKVSEEWDQELSLESMGLDVINLAAHLGYKTIDLLGFSMGGHIAQALISSPELTKKVEEENDDEASLVINGRVKVRKVILTATMTKLPRGDVNLNKLNAEAEKIKDKKERNDFITYNMMKVQYHDAVLGPKGELQGKFEKRLESVRNTNRPAWIIGLQFLAIQSADLRKQLHNVPQSLPIMVIHGDKDRMVLHEESDKIMEGIAHAKRLKDTPSGEFGHFWYEYFQLDYWVKSISNFLDLGKVGGHHESKL
ncbi:uncharacterized protein MEPE_06356 [Melanopsichium pennsylvanicum]|uniref:AB hydrolase-1 domain-containing protein n=2 Tax=Melanopsichium pennsylvanicum TaxID=63383 RepID=A0AAJ5C862_9BASI|nr:conserved hypothetical protein [Melanopsichium pennsylvanicum 4]SNX87646.1 uncharacterized protein MEPE_06356 [Melanopsichium pennsylvanicum]